MEPCVKVLGADFELSNAIESSWSRRGDVGRAAKLLLAEIDGLPRRDYWGGSVIEWGRRFLPSNGSSAYVDSDHLEINLPEHTKAADHVAHVYAGLKLARNAQLAAADKVEGRLNVTCAVSDARESWGHHLNVMVRRELFDAMFARKPHLLGFFAAHLATATLYTGQGKVGAGNDRTPCDFQLSQRADYFQELVGSQTMHDRPLVNVRDEAHASDPYARMHIIYFDRVLCPMANFLMAGATQLVLAMAEAGWADPDVLLDDPLAAAGAVSRDLTLRQPLRLARRGRQWTAVEVQRALCDLAGEFVAAGLADAVVPGAVDIVRCWGQTLELLRQRDLAALMRRCDWALKYLLLDRLRQRKGLDWDSAELRTLDHRYSSLDPDEGLFWQMAQAGQVDGVPSAATVDRFLDEPPDETRAYLRAHALRRFGEHASEVDWEGVRFRISTERYWYSEAVLAMPDPAGLNRAVCEPILADCRTVQELIAAVGGVEPSGRSSGPTRSWGWSQPDNPTPRLRYWRDGD